LLDHLEEAGFYSAKDLESISKTLDSMQEAIERGKDIHSPHLLTLLQSRLQQCHISLDTLYNGLKPLASELAPLHETLVSILRSTSAVNTRSKFSTSEVLDLQERLKEIQSRTKDGNFVGSDGQVLSGQEVVKPLWDRCWRWTELVLER
jgi:uncharacterized coiled-coil DUF342 family protein